MAIPDGAPERALRPGDDEPPPAVTDLVEDYIAVLLHGGSSGPPWPDMDPMPEAWDDAPYDGPVACSPAPNLEVVEALLEAGLLDDAERWLADDGPTMTGLRRLRMASWDARAAIARGRLALMRAYESVHGKGCLRSAEHRTALARTWHPFGTRAAAPTNESIGQAGTREAILNRRRMPVVDGIPVTDARFLPDQNPMPEAWDDAPYSGPPIRSPRPSARMLEGSLDSGDLDGAARWLREGALHMEELRRRGIPSWNARHALAQARYDLMRAYEAVHGAGCMREEAHRRALSKAWHPFGLEAEKAALEYRRGRGENDG